MTEGQPLEPVPETITVTDKRRIDPETGEARQAASGTAPSGSAPEAASPESAVSEDTADPVAELTADLQRVQADFANYRKRALRDQQAATERAKAGVVSQLLGVLDDLDRARSHGDLESGPLRSVADKLTGAMTALGLTPFGAGGEDFDPTLHEAVQHEGEGSRPVIGNVLRHGYRLGEQVLRHALVGVVDAVDAVAEDSSDANVADSSDNDSKSDEQTAESGSSES